MSQGYCCASVEDNFQSEEASCSDLHRSPTHINKLPGDVLAIIFKYIEYPKSRAELRQVCQEWKDVLDSLVGITVRVGTLSEHDPFFDTSSGNVLEKQDVVPKYHSPAIISSVGIEELMVGNISPNWPVDHDWGAWMRSTLLDLWRKTEEVLKPLPTIKNPDLITTLQIFGEIHPDHFSSLVNGLRRVRTFSISFHTLNCIDSTDLENLHFPELEVLTIRGGMRAYRYNSANRNWDLDNILRNLLTLISSEHSKLEVASLHYVYDKAKGLEITRTLLNFISQHCRTLKKFELQYWTVINSDPRIDDPPDTTPELLAQVASFKNHLKLSSFEIMVWVLAKIPFEGIWTEIAMSQEETLKELAITGACITMPMVQQVVSKNALSEMLLWDLKLFEDETNAALTVDCEILQNCPLTKLALRGWTVTLTTKTLINANFLPHTLTHIDLRDMGIAKEEIEFIALKLPLLQILTLFFIGNKRGMGVPVNLVAQVILSGHLQRVKIFRSLIGIIQKPGIFNGNVLNPEHICEQDNGLIAFQLEGDGFYRNINPEE